ncbi:hypothetical protein D3C84_237640 [compost metagenome]
MAEKTGTQHHTHTIDIDDVARTNRFAQLRVVTHVYKLGDIHHHVLGELAGSNRATNCLDGVVHGGDIHGAVQNFDSLHS